MMEGGEKIKTLKINIVLKIVMSKGNLQGSYCSMLQIKKELLRVNVEYCMMKLKG